MDEKLEACPFCGSEAKIVASNGYPTNHELAGGSRHVECLSCGAHGPIEPSHWDGKFWNTRATPDRSDDALAWLATKPRLAVEHFGPVYGDDDDQSTGWRVMRETGPINDREWDEVARGDTPLDAITAARAALKGDGL